MLGQTFNPTQRYIFSLFDPALVAKMTQIGLFLTQHFLECRKNDLKFNQTEMHSKRIHILKPHMDVVWMGFVKIRCHVYFLTTKALLTKQI